uniref:RNase H type-1 domain-containing protein n=1 Tax=Brassica oleracea var. oleracea TaxID=109376 RepID=A0A0D3A1P4_BRAOL
MHTFFSCPFAQEVWKLIPLRQVVHLATDINFKQALVEFRTAVCLPPSGIATTVLPWVLWAIWSTRNLHVFENQILSPMETATKALNLGREWNNAQQQIQLIGEESDTYIKKIDRKQCHGSATLESITTPLVAEAIALRSGLLSALELEHHKLKAFSDNLTLIRAINNDMQVKEIFGIVKDIQRISSVFVEISFSHLYRSLNVEADRLAKLSLFSSRVCDPSMD